MIQVSIIFLCPLGAAPGASASSSAKEFKSILKPAVIVPGLLPCKSIYTRVILRVLLSKWKSTVREKLVGEQDGTLQLNLSLLGTFWCYRETLKGTKPAGLDRGDFISNWSQSSCSVLTAICQWNKSQGPWHTASVSVENSNQICRAWWSWSYKTAPMCGDGVCQAELTDLSFVANWNVRTMLGCSIFRPKIASNCSSLACLSASVAMCWITCDCKTIRRNIYDWN